MHTASINTPFVNILKHYINAPYYQLTIVIKLGITPYYQPRPNPPSQSSLLTNAFS